MPRWALGLSTRLIASYILVTIAAVFLVEMLVLGFQVPRLLNNARLQIQVNAAAQSYGQMISRRYPDGVPTGTVLGDFGRKANPGVARTNSDGTLVVPAITGPIRSDQPVTAVVAIAADGTVLASSAPSRFRPGRGPPANSRSRRLQRTRSAVTSKAARAHQVRQRGFMVWQASWVGHSPPSASASRRVAFVYVQAPWSDRYISPVHALTELGQLGAAGPVLTGPYALVFAILPVGVLFGLLASRGLIRRVHRLERATLAVADGDYTVSLPASGRDELGRLEANFTTMARQLGSALDAERQRATSDARAAERARIAREVHDAISQHLFGLRMIAAGM